MKKNTKNRVACFICALLLFCTCLPFSAFAVDPVSAGVMANAFAQAIAAYGASNGVAMTFDVANTSSIGEAVHDLWARFRSGTQGVDDYATLAAALFPDLYYKASVAVGTAADIYTVGYNISAEYAEEFDNFWDWVLSGPAEMTRVDNESYVFPSAQVGALATPITLVQADSYPFLSMPTGNYSDAQSLVSTGMHLGNNSAGNSLMSGVKANSGATVYPIAYLNSSNKWKQAAFSVSSFDYYRASYYTGSNSYSAVSSASSSSIAYNGFTYYEAVFSNELTSSYIWEIPTFSSYADARNAWLTWIGAPTYRTTIGVKAYDRDGIATIPDTSDPNYEAVAKRIPSDVPWDNSLYGDGTGALTGTQAGEVAAGVDDVLAEDGVLSLAGDQVSNPPSDEDPPSTDPDDYLVVGLEDIFPFCIPFDIYNFLAALAANPVAPHFTCTLEFPDAIGGDQTIDIDLDTPTFNQLAQLLRLLELLAFIVGLALLTRSMFIRG